MLSDERDEDEDDTVRLSDLIALAEAGLKAKEDDDTFFTQAAEAADEAEAAYYGSVRLALIGHCSRWFSL